MQTVLKSETIGDYYFELSIDKDGTYQVSKGVKATEHFYSTLSLKEYTNYKSALARFNRLKKEV